ncbi:MAG TPA: ATP-binding protein [Anaerolineae bacterium]|nr:ATP-binding protein [Anaerolineae bacterium]
MFSWLWRLPQFDNAEELRKARLLNNILVIAISTLGVALIILILVAENLTFESVQTLVLLLGLMLLTKGLLFWGRVDGASFIFLSATTYLLLKDAYDFSGIVGSAYMGMTAVIVVASALLGPWVGIGYAGVAAGFGLWLAYLQANGLWEMNTINPSPYYSWSIRAAVFIIIARLVSYVMGQYEQMWQKSEAHSAEMVVANEALERVRSELEARVVARTSDLAAANRALQETNERLQRTNVDLEAAKVAAEAASEAKDDFMANMSHELRTPMGAVIGMAELLEETDLSVKQAGYVETIQRSGESLLGIINDILDFARIEGRQVVLEKRPFSLAETLTSVVDMVSFEAEKKGVGVRIDVDRHVPTKVEGDGLRLRQVLLNLVQNGVKFTEKGEVVLLVQSPDEEESGRLRFVVSDTGVGIPAERQSQLFQPFTQADTSMTRRFGGAGLGLVIAQKLVGLMGGEIVFESEVGKGTTFEFTISLPTVLAKPVAVAEGVSRPLLLADRLPLNILVVEDNEINQLLATSVLERLGYEVAVVANGAEAVAAVEGGDYDMILMDLQMPVMDGVTATKRIRGLVGIEQPRIVAVTANASGEVRAECEAVGMDGFVAKPYQIADIVVALEAAVG